MSNSYWGASPPPPNLNIGGGGLDPPAPWLLRPCIAFTHVYTEIHVHMHNILLEKGSESWVLEALLH